MGVEAPIRKGNNGGFIGIWALNGDKLPDIGTRWGYNS